MDLDDILNLQRLQCTGDVSRAGWVIDQDEVIAALDFLHVELMVHIRFMTGKYTYGTHRNKSSNAHHITLDQNKSIISANFTLWHELAHAMQAERFSKQMGVPVRAFHAEWKKRGYTAQAYYNNIYEIEANEIAAENEPTLLLAYV